MKENWYFRICSWLCFCGFSLFMLIGSDVYAQTERTIELLKPGTLGNFINRDEMYSISKLTIKGDINGTDINMLRDMSGNDMYCQETPGILSELDLNEAHIVSGGSPYMIVNDDYMLYTSDDTISMYMFWKCIRLRKIVLPKDVKTIGKYAFSFCENLKSVEIPEGVSLLDEYAFQTCFELESVRIPSSVKKINPFAFFYCVKLTSIELSEGVDSIGHQAFSFTAQTEQYFPSSVRYIAPLVFYGTPVQSWNIDENNACYSAGGNVLFNKDKTILKVYLPTEAESYVVPEGVVRLENQSFIGGNLKSITLPESLQVLPLYVFQDVPLEEINCKGQIPPICETEIVEGQYHGPFAFYEDSWYDTTVLNVPVGSSALYREAPVWKDFKNIRESEDVSIENNLKSSASVNVYTLDNMLFVENLVAGTEVRIYSIYGALVSSMVADREAISIRLPKDHAYLVKVGTDCVKVVL